MAGLDGQLWLYLCLAPKYSKKNAKLNTKITGWDIKPSTYRQYQSDGKRMIEAFHGDLQRRITRRQRQDTFARLRAILQELVAIKLLDERQTRNLPRLVDLARARNWDSTTLTRDRIISLREDCLTADEWGRIKRGAALLDYLRRFETCRGFLPAMEIGCLKNVSRLDSQIPEFLAIEAAEWVETATIEYNEDCVTEEAREATAREQSEGSKGIYSAAIRKYLNTARGFRDLGSVNGLAPLFEPDLIEKMLVRMVQEVGTPTGLAPRSLYNYATRLKLMLLARGMRAEAQRVENLIDILPVMTEGKNASQFMSEKTKAWCKALIKCPVKMEIFDTQHLQYVERAQTALSTSRIAGIDLEAYAKSPDDQLLTEEERRLADHLLRQARMFGTCAAFAAIELDGGPLRKSNVLDLAMSGHPQTFFDHRRDPTSPRIEIHIPNELLKNGEHMTQRQQFLPTFVFEKHGLGADSYQILSFFLDCIRPLFRGAEHSALVFPAIEPLATPLVVQTFASWLARCSTDIGLTVLPHNLRHGFCTIEIKEDPTCFPELEAITGDRESTLRRGVATVRMNGPEVAASLA